MLSDSTPSNRMLASMFVIVVSTTLWFEFAHGAELWAHRLAVQQDVRYGEDPLQTMDAYIYGRRVGEPVYFEIDATKRPTLVWFHGGGWLSGDKTSDLPLFLPYLQRGWNVVAVNYRIGANTAPQAIDDALCAYRSTLRQLTQIDQDNRDVVVSGSGVGGQLALLVGLLNSGAQGDDDHPCRSAPPRAVVNWYGITDLVMADTFLEDTRAQRNYVRLWAGGVDRVAEVAARYSPMVLVSERAPPIITIHGLQDSVVPVAQALKMHAALNTPNKLIQLSANHGGFSDRQYARAYRNIFNFLKRHPPPS